MRAVLAHLVNEGCLSEGQASHATGLWYIELRDLCIQVRDKTIRDLTRVDAPPPPIYRTITGQIQCCLVGGVLYERHWPQPDSLNGDDAPPGRWKASEHSLEEVRTAYTRLACTKNPYLETDRYQMGCRLHCYMNLRPSVWYVQPNSEALTQEIERLMRERETALAQEAADRPQPTQEALL